MTLPARGSMQVRAAKRQGTKKRAGPEIVSVLVLCLAASIFVIFQQTKEIMEHNDKNLAQIHDHAHQQPVRKVGTKPLEHEDAFLATIKSCLPQTNKKCKTFIPEKTTTQRVALMAPPGDITHALFRLLQVVVGRAKRKQTIDIELVPTTHMAPYGYGKTHGWTKIIRVVPRPLLLGVTNTLQSALIPGETFASITIDDIKSSLRQQIRYHCRLSHIAAHTALWSVDLDSLANLSMDSLMEQIQDFLSLEMHDFLGEMIPNIEGDVTDDLVPPDDFGIFSAMSSYGASMLTHAQASTNTNILEELDRVLLEEMRISKNLTAWPCQGFWAVGDPLKDPVTLSPIISRIAHAMSPNCTSPLTSCFVKKDLCEANGDAECKGK